MIDRRRLRAVLGIPELAWLVERLRRRVESGRALTGSVSLRDPTPAQRRAVDRLLGRPPSRGGVLHVRLGQLEDLLRHAELCGGLRAAVEVLAGPLVDRRAEREARERGWQQVMVRAEAADPRPQVVEWLRERRTRTLLRRYSGRDPAVGEVLLARALAVAGRLPARGVPLAELAAELSGDSHALDAGRPLGTLVVALAARLGGAHGWRGAEGRREAWESVGVLKDDVSASVLVHGLTAAGTSLVDRTLAAHAEAGEPCRLTTGQLLRHPPRFAGLGTVHVCENPAVVSAAARRLGSACAPLVCVDGQPTIAVHSLLARLAAAGAHLVYHGDFDWTGLKIAARLMARHAARPWRFGAADYLAAAGGVALSGEPVEAPWDADLAPAMRQRGLAVHEEQVLDPLLADLVG